MITLDANERYAICKIVNDDGRDILVQQDHSAPSVASTFGWSLQSVGEGCDHDGTDGTVDCKTCGCTAGRFIAAAIEYINEHDGDTVEDPGYFQEGDDQ